MDVLVWNMNQKHSNWSLLQNGGDLAADVQIVCEAPKPPRGVEAVGEWRTIGLEEDLPLDRVRCDRPWSTGVIARRATSITDARSARAGYRQPALLPFRPSRPGTWTAVEVLMGRARVTVVALYGLLDEKSDASVHRSLSELSPIFDHPRYRKRVILGGDLNVPANLHADDVRWKRCAAVLARLDAYGLVNCVDHAKPSVTDEPFECPCGASPCRRHRRTFWRPGSAHYQEDYLLVSRDLFDRAFESCEVLPFRSSSDHAPIRATFAL
jgi:hypothetical protein